MAWIRRREKSPIDSSKPNSVPSADLSVSSMSPSPMNHRGPNRRISSLEVMEPRTLMATDTLWVGGVYFEEDSGSDLHGDLFQVTFKGGAAGTELNRLIIDGDQNTPGFGVGDVFFDTIEAGMGADHAYPFRIVQLVTADPNAKVTATVQDGSTRLVLDFENFRAGDKLIFEIDVDEVEDFDPSETNLTVINDGIDPITSGVEFQGSSFEAFFSAPHFVDASATGTFMNRYDSMLAGTGLDLPQDDFQGKRDRSTGVATSTDQIPLPVTLAGKVFVDNDLNLIQSSGEKSLSSVRLDLYRKNSSGTFEFTGFWTTTDANGRYSFGTNLKLMPGIYQVRQTQPDGYFSVGAVPGNITGRTDLSPVGTVAGNLDWLTEIEIPLGDLHAVDLNFAEAEPAEISGWVYSDPNDNGFKESGEAGLPGVTIRLEPITSLNNLGTVKTTVTDSNGRYRFTGLVPGKYKVVETVQPTGYFDGKETVGRVSNIVVGNLSAGNDVITDIVLIGGSVGTEYNFGEIPPAEISGTVFHDENDNGKFDSSTEQRIPNVLIRLLDSNGTLVNETRTDNQGNYRFTNVRPGKYTLIELTPPGYIDGQDEVGKVDGTTSGKLDQSDRMIDIMLSGNSVGSGYNFGELIAGSIAGKVWVDVDEDCIRDPNEGPLPGVTIELLDELGNVLRTTTTDSSGNYKFDNLPPGKYSVRQIQPADYFHGGQMPPPNNGDGSTKDLITNIVVKSGQEVTDADFCEIPPVTISGYVFQDGPVIFTPGGVLPANLNEIRDGSRTDDDTYLMGVRVELRDSNGRLVDASSYLDNSASKSSVAMTSNAGYYEFRGLKPGTYYLFESQPANLFDAIDTPGTTGGFAINPGQVLTAEQQAIVDNLNANPQTSFGNDGIMKVAVRGGVHSQENNFSEVLVLPVVEPPRPPTIEEPTPDPPIPPTLGQPVIFDRVNPPPPGAFPAAGPLIGAPWVIGVNRLDPGPGHDIPYTWHLSVINAGYPRGDRPDHEVDSAIAQKFSRRLDLQTWALMDVRESTWMVASVDNKDVTPRTNFDLIDARVLAGDFNGDGTDEITLFIDGEWLVDTNGNGLWDRGDLWLRLGGQGDDPVVGDWDNDGKDDVGIFGPQWRGDRRALAAEVGLPTRSNPIHNKPQNPPPDYHEATDGQRLMQRTANATPRADAIDHVFRFGYNPDIAVVGDWNGDGITKIGVYRNGLWMLDIDGDGQFTQRDKSVGFGAAGEQPFVGDFDGDGIDELAVQRGNQLIVDSNHNGEIDAADMVFELEGADAPGAAVVVGDFNGDGKDEPAVYRRDAIQLPLETKAKAG